MFVDATATVVKDDWESATVSELRRDALLEAVAPRDHDRVRKMSDREVVKYLKWVDEYETALAASGGHKELVLR